MSHRSVYLAKYRSSSRQRAHFAIFIPDIGIEGRDLGKSFRSASTKGTVIHVIGEPVLAGYALEIKRNYECKESRDLEELVLLGHVDPANVYNPTDTEFVKNDKARTAIEREAVRVPPPPRGQNVRAPINGVTTKRCQEWTMEFLYRLVEKRLIPSAAVSIAQDHRDAPTLGIFGQK
ncbi:hypothetical protein S40288_04954 [Stachybotrys chartarum IBT 40288]|nr:hypothetical protein S40288_04954 [Stachybotrys chartarum IBT 40288]